MLMQWVLFIDGHGNPALHLGLMGTRKRLGVGEVMYTRRVDLETRTKRHQRRFADARGRRDSRAPLALMKLYQRVTIPRSRVPRSASRPVCGVGKRGEDDRGRRRHDGLGSRCCRLVFSRLKHCNLEPPPFPLLVAAQWVERAPRAPAGWQKALLTGTLRLLQIPGKLEEAQ
jgi:hypothetical protein